jgi:hypothetical protein
MNLNQKTPGMPVQAFGDLTGLAPRQNGKPAVAGPDTPYDVPVRSDHRRVGIAAHLLQGGVFFKVA